jgi:hypothetical protein
LVLTQMIPHDTFHHLLLSTSLTLSWSQWGQKMGWYPCLAVTYWQPCAFQFIFKPKKKIKFKRYNFIDTVLERFWMKQFKVLTEQFILDLVKAQKIVELLCWC